MFRKLNIRTLVVVFAVFLVVAILVQVIDNPKGINTLKNELFTINQEEVSSVILQPRMLKGNQIELKNESGNWKVIYDGKAYNGDNNTIESLIRQLNGLKPLRLAAQNKDRWGSYELTDSLSTKVTLKGAEGELAKLYIGKFSYQQPKQNSMMQQNPYMQQRGTMTTYVRSGDDVEVYAVEGFLGSTTNRNADAFKDKTIVKVSKNDINKLAFELPNESYMMVKNENNWMADGITLDSTAVANYLSGITNVKGATFTEEVSQAFTHKLTIYTNKGETIEVKAKLEEEDAIIASSNNVGNVFKEKKENSFTKLFVSKQSLE